MVAISPADIVTAPKALLPDHLDGGLRPATVAELAEAVGLDPRRLGGEMWGHVVDGRVEALCHAAANLVPGRRGIIEAGVEQGHDQEHLGLQHRGQLRLARRAFQELAAEDGEADGGAERAEAARRQAVIKLHQAQWVEATRYIEIARDAAASVGDADVMGEVLNIEAAILHTQGRHADAIALGHAARLQRIGQPGAGARELAESVDGRFHNAYVREMSEPLLLAWAEELSSRDGLTRDVSSFTRRAVI